MKHVLRNIYTVCVYVPIRRQGILEHAPLNDNAFQAKVSLHSCHHPWMVALEVQL